MDITSVRVDTQAGQNHQIWCPLVRTEVKHCPILRIATTTQTGFLNKLLRKAWNCVLSSIYMWN